MSLTADQITAKNFEEYHKRILPFLNGSFPTPIVNKFSKGDLYSTDEKIVGQWIDGKPLYQKTIDCGALPNNTEKKVYHQIANIDKVVYAFGVGFSSSGVSTFIGYCGNYSNSQANIGTIVTREYISIFTVMDRSSYSSSYTTIQYTKTTDSPISIGDGNDYSTDEQIVGRWIDGKPLYQKVFTGLNASLNTSDWNTVCTIADLDLLINGWALYNNTGTGKMNIVQFKEIEPQSSGITIKAQLNGSRTINMAVFQYTKTTD